MCYEKYTKVYVVTILDLDLWWERRLGQATFGELCKRKQLNL